jgi:NADH-quinone oxidoreductase subunit L
MKAFLVNRVGDFGFVLGIAGVVYYTAQFGGASLNYTDAFKAAPQIAAQTFALAGTDGVNAMTFICIALFIGAMGKSAQVPLHVWLPDSMEGPTPISALIHAATMVTAGIFMVARMSPLFEYSEVALSFVLMIGATTALFMGFLGIINNDIKRVIAYSTLSQLGYMTVALGASAYNVAIFHLMTHAFFKALLFLAAGSVIIGMHHEQDMRKMGGLFSKMKITAVTCWIGALALIGTPFFSGFYSKDLLIEAVGEAHRPFAEYAYFCVMAGVFVTAFYTFRLIFMTFHGKPRWAEAGHGIVEAHEDHAHDSHADTHPDVHAPHDDHGPGAHGVEPHESPWVVTWPLMALALLSIIAGYVIGPLIFKGGFGTSIFILEHNDVVGEIGRTFHGALGFAIHGMTQLPFILAILGVASAWALYIKWPHLPGVIDSRLKPVRFILENKYGFDAFNERILARLSRGLGTVFWKVGDQGLIDGAVIGGSTGFIDWFAGVARRVQSGFLYSYAFWMVIGLAVMLGWSLSHLH